MGSPLSLKTNYISFLHLRNPPSRRFILNQKQAIDKGTNNTEYIDLRKRINDTIKESFQHARFYMVSSYELNSVAKSSKPRSCLVSCTIPSALSITPINDRAPRFNCSGYHHSDNLFLMEDVIGWGHGNGEWTDIRTAADLIESIRENSYE